MSAYTMKQAAVSRIEADSTALVELSRRVHAHPELAFAEERASHWCAEMLSEAGFDVERGVAGLPTALRATAGSGSLRIALCAEYDAYPGIGHACGHNVICVASVGAAIGAAAVADAADLAVVVLGTPGEELFGLCDIPPGIPGAGKAVLLQAGAFDGVHAALMCHPAPVDIATASTRAITRIRARFAVAAPLPCPDGVLTR
jgi:metal-dependent amidase/aminoacylase/carboxypeptidase family protein